MIIRGVPEITSFGPSAFGNCINLETVTAPKTLKIDSFTTNDAITIFQNCNKITSLDFPLLTRWFSNSALKNLTGLTTLNIPKCTILGKTVLDNSFFLNIRLGLVVNCNIFLQTNNSGNPDGDLAYLTSTRQGVVNYIN